MPTHPKRLLIIDNTPWDDQLINYFAQFDYQIKQIQHINLLPQETEPLAVLLVHWSFFAQDSTLLETLYQHYPVPLIVISDAANADMCIPMLEAGADDFLIKPLHPRELHARISAVSRRVFRSIQEKELEKEVLLFAEWRLYPASRQIFNTDNQELALSAGEYDLLLAFIRQPQCVLGREFLLQITKNSDLNPFDRRIDVQISRLRQKIETDAKKPALIKTIRNAGYMFTAQVSSLKEGEPI